MGRRNERGFTLIELLVVIAIISILLAVAAPKVLNSLARARDTRASANIAVIQGALEQFREEYGQYPATLKQLRDRGLVKDGYDFKNGYGYYYFYAAEAKTTGQSFRKYVLADPGDSPSTWSGTDGTAGATKPPEGADPSDTAGDQIYTFGNENGDVVQEIDYNHDGDFGETGEDTTYADADAFQYHTSRPDKNNVWTTYSGPYATEED